MTDHSTPPRATPGPVEPDNPSAYALARHIADYPVSVLQAAFRYLNSPIILELHDDGLPPAPAPVPDAGLREQLAAAIRDAACDGSCGQTEAECARTRIQPIVWDHGGLAEVSGSPEMFADAVLAALDQQQAVKPHGETRMPLAHPANGLDTPATH